MKRLLVTGVSGLLGINLAWLAADRYEIVGVMRGERAVPCAGRSPFQTILADLSVPGEVERVFELAQPDFVINCAALTQVDLCEQYPEEANQLNAVLPGKLANLSARAGAQLLHISTDAVFDGLRGDYTEADMPQPINVYAKTKLDGERAVLEANSDALVARVNFYGWSWQGSRSLAEYFFNQLSAGIPVKGFSDIVFSPLLVNDIVEVLLCMLERRLNGLYHVTSPESLSKFEFAQMLARAFGFDETLISPASYKTGGLRAPRSPLLTLRPDKLLAELDGSVCHLPGQEPAMQRFSELYQQRYPQTLRSLFVAPDHSPAG